MADNRAKASVPAMSFTPDALRRAAIERAGADDFGSDSYQAGLDALLYSINHEAQLNERGQAEMWARIVDSLANRLALVAWEKLHPGPAAAPIEAPLVVLGLPRTGSSIMHETLASAPDTCTPLLWQTREFALVHEVGDARADERVASINANIAAKNDNIPGVLAIHYEDAYVPAECVFLMQVDLVSSMFSTIAWTPTYRRFLLEHDATETYAWHKRALRYLSAANPGKRWVLKAPIHSLYIGALLETYPDAMLVHTHRDPIEVIGSLCSYCATLRGGFSDHVDTPAQAPDDAAYPARYVEGTIAYREAHPDIDARICDVAFSDFMKDQAGTLARIYTHIGLPFTDAARDAMLDYLANRPREKYGAHEYSLEAMGLNVEGLRALYSDYADRYRNYL